MLESNIQLLSSLQGNCSPGATQRSKFFQETAATADPANSSDSHILSYDWTMFFHSRSRPPKEEPQQKTPGEVPNVDAYLQTTNEISFPRVCGPGETATIASVEQLWQSLALTKRTYELSIGSELFIFKSGIEPVWEDKLNAKGGRWMFKFSRRQNERHGQSEEAQIRRRTCMIWERLVLRVLGGSFYGGDILLHDISGLVISIRRDEDIISIWNTNLCFGKRRASAENGGFNDRRMICSSVLRVIREVDEILRHEGSVLSTVDDAAESNERVYGVNFEYRLHSDSESSDHKPRRYNKRGNHHNTGHYHEKEKNEHDLTKIDSGQLANLGRSRRRKNIEGGTLLSMGSRRRLQMKNKYDDSTETDSHHPASTNLDN